MFIARYCEIDSRARFRSPIALAIFGCVVKTQGLSATRRRQCRRSRLMLGEAPEGAFSSPRRDAAAAHRGSERTREGGEHGQAEYDAPRVHEAGRRHRGCRCRGCACGCRAGRVEQRYPKQGWRDQARAFLLPRLRQDGMRRVGRRRERPRYPHGRRRERVPFHGQPLQQGPGVAAGGVPPRPSVPPHEAHERTR